MLSSYLDAAAENLQRYYICTLALITRTYGNNAMLLMLSSLNVNPADTIDQEGRAGVATNKLPRTPRIHANNKDCQVGTCMDAWPGRGSRQQSVRPLCTLIGNKYIYLHTH